MSWSWCENTMKMPSSARLSRLYCKPTSFPCFWFWGHLHPVVGSSGCVLASAFQSDHFDWLQRCHGRAGFGVRSGRGT
ncbi:hypothetical protein Pan216_23670 [Planctomycetes bacterium Pan216]|uniref:Uncharacterized protein n=1 Tax=Kolteria novifilia TaxID=2527975 RepID=A0A518B3L1_9BACT|nr:hypothetical protein Pan216_23670 [Planctomycetes bacterium Pan216]